MFDIWALIQSHNRSTWLADLWITMCVLLFCSSNVPFCSGFTFANLQSNTNICGRIVNQIVLQWRKNKNSREENVRRVPSGKRNFTNSRCSLRRKRNLRSFSPYFHFLPWWQKHPTKGDFCTETGTKNETFSSNKSTPKKKSCVQQHSFTKEH